MSRKRQPAGWVDSSRRGTAKVYCGQSSSSGYIYSGCHWCSRTQAFVWEEDGRAEGNEVHQELRRAVAVSLIKNHNSRRREQQKWRRRRRVRHGYERGDATDSLRSGVAQGIASKAESLTREASPSRLVGRNGTKGTVSVGSVSQRMEQYGRFRRDQNHLVGASQLRKGGG